jgi:hypothetical protein
MIKISSHLLAFLMLAVVAFADMTQPALAAPLRARAAGHVVSLYHEYATPFDRKALRRAQEYFKRWWDVPHQQAATPLWDSAPQRTDPNVWHPRPSGLAQPAW